ncbi:MAG TPA: ATP-binding protein [Azospirillaceae bacterium]|nr:ATP-binding protein [Azospirillaceae bacterium]
MMFAQAPQRHPVGRSALAAGMAGAGALCAGGAALAGLAPAWAGAAAGLAAGGALLALAVRHRQVAREAARVASSEQVYREIFENSVEGVFASTPEGRFLWANPTMARLLGYDDAPQLVAECTDIARQLYADPETRNRFARMLLAEGAVTGYEAEAIRRDGTTIWISISARVVRDEEGRPAAFQGTCEDITPRRRAEEALRRAKQLSETASRAKTEFLANMSHELRTPLNAIIGFSEIIGEQQLGPAGHPDYAEYARDINESGRMLLDLINDILDLSKIEAGRRELNEHLVDLPRTLHSCLRLVKERAIRGGVTTLLDVPRALPRLRADEVALKQMLSNLLSNAVKFTPKGGRVTLSASVEADGTLVIGVADTGIGMRPEEIPRALQPFTQIEGNLSRTAGGAGLGLPMVRALAELHGGSLSLESEPGRGTVARVRLPAERVQPAKDAAPDVGVG